MRGCTMFGLSSVVCLFQLASFCVADPPAPKKAGPVEQVRKAAETAEVHGIGLSGPLYHRLDGIKELPALIKSLRAKDKKEPVQRVWEMLGKETQKRILDDKYYSELGKPDSSLASGLEAFVASDLRKIIDTRPDFYTEEAFKTVLLTKEMKDLIALGKKRTFLQTAKLNWWLLEKVFPNSIPEMPERFRTVRVEVLSGKAVVLVLASSNSCRWEVKLREGAKVTGVVLCGSGAAEVVGVDTPLVYRCYYQPDGVTAASDGNFFSAAYDKDSERYKEFASGVKQLVGKEFTSFQTAPANASHRPKPGDEPYIVLPVAEK